MVKADHGKGGWPSCSFSTGAPTMADNFAILFSTLMILFTAFRALRLDHERPWFEIKEPDAAQATEASHMAGRDDDGNAVPVWRRRR